jgi:acetolactate synthase I/II/III large subunit
MSETVRLADYVINFLAEQGIKEVFCVYGSANGDLIDAFTRNDKIRYICTLHEQAAGFAAEAYSRVSKKFGVASATSGPGGHNLITPIANCYYESVPVLFITGQQITKFLKKTNKIRQNAFQETEIIEIVSPIIKYSKMILDKKSIRHELEKSIHLMTSGRPGPVLLDIPIDIQKSMIDPNTLIGFVKDESLEILNERKNNAQNFIIEYIGDLKKAKRPAIIVGGGVRLAGCEKELLELLKLLKVPVFPTWNALDTIASDFEFYGGRIGTYGGDGRNFGIQNCDLLLCLATRVSGRITGGNPSYFARGAKKYIVDIDAEILKDGQHDVKFDKKLCHDIKDFITEFLLQYSKVDDRNSGYNEWTPAFWNTGFSEWNKVVQNWKDQYRVVSPQYYKETRPVNPYVFIELLGKKLKNNDIIIGDCGGNIVITSQALQTKTGQMFFSNNSNSPMGFSFSAAIGAWFASKPDQNVVCIIGDGGMNMNIQELQTLCNYKIGIKVIILNNKIYGITKAFQKTNFNGRFEACGPKGYNPPDFGKVVRAYGIEYFSITSNNEISIDKILEKVLSYPHNSPVVLNVDCQEYHKYIPRIVGWNTPIEDMYPYLPREEFKKNMFIDPVEHWQELNVPNIAI